MTEPVVREILLQQEVDDVVTASVEIRRITMQPDVAAGPHHHNGPVFGVIEAGSVVFQVDGGPAVILRTGDTFYEPANVLIDRFDSRSEGAVFVGTFLTARDEGARLIMDPPAS